MPEDTEIPSGTVLEAPGSPCTSTLARAWQQIAYRPSAHQITQAITPCVQAAELIRSTTPTIGQGNAGRLLDPTSTTERALDTARELICQASKSNDACRAVCGEPISILASTGTNRQHCEQQPGPAADTLRSQVRELGHSPVPARRPYNRPSIVSGRAIVSQGQSCRSLSRP